MSKKSTKIFTNIFVLMNTISMALISYYFFNKLTSWLHYVLIGSIVVGYIVYLIVPKSYSITSKVVGIMWGVYIAFSFLVFAIVAIYTKNVFESVISLIMLNLYIGACILVYKKWYYISILILLMLFYVPLVMIVEARYDEFEYIALSIILGIYFVFLGFLLYGKTNDNEIFVLE